MKNIKKKIKLLLYTLWSKTGFSKTVLKVAEFAQGVRFSISEALRRGNIILPTVHNNWVIINLRNMNKVGYIPTPSERYHTTEQHVAELKEIYEQSGFVEIDEGDTVFDVGAYVGAFSKIACEKASRVIAIDPNAKLDKSIYLNTEKCKNIEIIPSACWYENKKGEMNISFSPSENSLLSVDSYDSGTKVTIDMKTVCGIAKERGIDKINFLKVEAEGAEPEVLKGAFCECVDIDKISINCGPERFGEEPVEEVVKILKKNGYRYNVKKTPIWGASIVYAKKKKTD